MTHMWAEAFLGVHILKQRTAVYFPFLKLDTASLLTEEFNALISFL